MLKFRVDDIFRHPNTFKKKKEKKIPTHHHYTARRESEHIASTQKKLSDPQAR